MRSFLPPVLWLFQVGLWLLLGAVSLHLLRLGAAAWRLPLSPPPRDPPPPSDKLPPVPIVTIQLPLYNEVHVAARAIHAACALAWPRDRLEVQVLDDSTDDTRGRVEQAAAAERARGIDVAVLRRPDRAGYKAGALAAGLPRARGAFLAVLDADAVPPPDFLLRLVPPLLADERLGFAQGRWSFDNQDRSLLTRLQALLLHGLMLVEQSLLSRRRLPLQFNGSGGVWRRTALEAAGGWLGAAGTAGTKVASVTEDLDLSYRARLCGYLGLLVPEVAVRTELPETMAAFRSQQKRWVRGGAEVLRAVLRRLRGGPEEVATMLAHLLRHARQPYLLLSALLLPAWLLGPYRSPLPFLPLLLVLHAALGVYYGAALRRLGRSPLPAFLLAPFLCALSLGMSLSLSAALLSGLLSGGRGGVFVRTPKTGGPEMGGARDRALRYLPDFDPLALAECAIGLGHAALAVVLLWRGAWGGALLCLFYVGGGFLSVGLGSLRRGA